MVYEKMTADGRCVTSSENKREQQKPATAVITMWTFTVLKQQMTYVTTLKFLNQKRNHGHHMD